jgi:hypothetical protein
VGLATIGILASPADARTRFRLVSLTITTAYGSILAKVDDWSDPRTDAEKAFVSPSADESARGGANLPLVAHAWDTIVRATARVRLPANEPLDATARLTARSDVAELDLLSSEAPRLDGNVAVFALAGPAALEHRIASHTGVLRWTLRWRGRDVELGQTRETLLVTAGPPRAGTSWPLDGKAARPIGPDHNAFTAFRLSAAVRIAGGARSPTEAAELAWKLAKRRYDLSADADLNPWALLAEETGGQCMTTASFIEGVFDILGFEGGRVLYVYPSLKRPRAAGTTALANPKIPGAFTVEAPSYDVGTQFRTVVSVASPGPGEHSPARAAAHQGKHGIERLKMRDGLGELHNYAAAFVVEEHGVRSYYGGGYAVGPFHAADAFLAGACRAVLWTYEDAETDDWDRPCDAPGAVLSWSTGALLSR